MSDEKEVKEVMDRVIKKLIDDGQLIEAGFQSLLAVAYKGITIPPEIQEQMREVFFGGAQHLHGAVFQVMDEGTEPTENDMRRLDNIHKELEAFLEKFKKKHGL